MRKSYLTDLSMAAESAGMEEFCVCEPLSPQPRRDESGAWRWDDCQWIDEDASLASIVESHSWYRVGNVVSVTLESGAKRCFRVSHVRLTRLQSVIHAPQIERIQLWDSCQVEPIQIWDSRCEECLACTWAANPWVWAVSYKPSEGLMNLSTENFRK